MKSMLFDILGAKATLCMTVSFRAGDPTESESCYLLSASDDHISSHTSGLYRNKVKESSAFPKSAGTRPLRNLNPISARVEISQNILTVHILGCLNTVHVRMESVLNILAKPCIYLF